MRWARQFEAASVASLQSDAPKKAKQMGAAIFAGPILMVTGYNTQNTTHPRAKYGIHAELRALIRRRYYGDEGCTMYIWRELADGTPACSRPCPACLQLIKESGSIACVRFIDEAGQPAEIMVI